MKRSQEPIFRNMPIRLVRQRAQTRISLLMAVFLAGAAASALWFFQRNAARSLPAPELSTVTLNLLNHLPAPIEIRFYSMLDTSSIPSSVQTFSAHVGDKLAAYQAASSGKIKFTSVTNSATFDPNAATADGMKPFNIDKGDACFLGVAMAQGKRKEVISRLDPEWESALEADLTRALKRLIAEPNSQNPTALAEIDKSSIEDVKKLIPNLQSVSNEEGTRVLREAALAEFKAAAAEMDAKLKKAQQNLAQAQASQSETEQQAAMKQLQQVQSEQMETLKEIAARAQARSAAFQQIKAKP